MFIIIGLVVVFGAVVGGFLMEHGNLKVLIQPSEVVTIGGAALGTILVANPLYVVKKLVSGIAGAFGGSKYGKPQYMDTLKMMFELFSRARRDGLMALETDSDNPEQSTIFSKYPKFLKDHHALDFVCDSIRMASSGGIEPFDADQMIENDMDVHHHGAVMPIGALSTVADSLPGLGIVAAVLGVVITMGALGGPAEEIGHKVAAALVGTFLGILLCYGLVGPVSQNMAKVTAEEHAYFYVLRVLMLAFIRGQPPVVAVEMGRRAIPTHIRPSFSEVEEACRNGAAAAEAS
jgi:chemotaxis protein MotA